MKLSVVRGDESTGVESLETAPADIVAVAHRVVHGGNSFLEPVLVDDEVVERLRGLVELAPIHNAAALAAIDAARRRFPDLPHVAVFDTAFHVTIPPEAATYALPERFRAAGIRRYGFHGLSVQWAAERVPVARLVVCHLGGGCSITAVRDGRSIDTSMGFTPLEGVPMATRSGTVDPGALLYLLRHGLSVEELEQALEHESGLRGLSGLDSVRELEQRDSAADRLALAVFSYRVAGAVAEMAAALDGLDALVFTAGIGENSAGVRERVCSRLSFLGVALDAGTNRSKRPDVDVQASGSAVRVAVIRAREDMVAARAARALL
ncbi:MAG: acetate/propionate family kinase [Actinomycetota bacterium]|nr:acetate/propionate family kinase [Actinomycetota bacterium]